MDAAYCDHYKSYPLVIVNPENFITWFTWFNWPKSQRQKKKVLKMSRRRSTYSFHSLSQRDHIFGLLLQYILNENNNNQSRGAAGDEIINCRKLVFKQSKAILASLPFPRLERSKKNTGIAEHPTSLASGTIFSTEMNSFHVAKLDRLNWPTVSWRKKSDFRKKQRLAV